MAKVSYQREWVKCGKKGCKKCPHGPYWYAYWREGSKIRKKYIGKTKPDGATDNEQTSIPHRWDAIFDARKATVLLAAEILGFDGGCTLDEARKAWRELVWKAHPDRGGDSTYIRHYNSAWEHIRAHYAWEESNLA